MNNRSRKRQLYTQRRMRHNLFVLTAEDRAWLDMAPVGREFGSPDYDRLEQLDAERYLAGNAEDDVKTDFPQPDPLVKDMSLTASKAEQMRRPGSLAGLIVPDDFDQMGRAEIEQLFSEGDASTTRPGRS